MVNREAIFFRKKGEIVTRKKLIVVGALLASAFLASVAIGASINGDYNGFPIVKIIVNGQPYTGDVPAINFNGVTMVPIRFVAETLGQNVAWDSKTWIATIGNGNAGSNSSTAIALPPATSVGYSRLSPAPLGTKLVAKIENIFDQITAEITLADVIRGAEAWQRIKQANMFNDPPKDGYEYILAKVKFKLLKIDDASAAYDLSGMSFTAVSSTGKDYEVPSIVEPDPSLDAKLYINAENEGWIAFSVSTDDPEPLITFGRDYQGKGGVWFNTK